MSPKGTPGIKRLNLEQIGRAVLLAFAADIPIAVWGKPGTGKSTKIKAVIQSLGWRLCDFRLSDKEPADLGGIPYPIITDAAKYLEYLMTKQLPFDNDEKAGVLFDEWDRAPMEVQNVALQVILDRMANNHPLSVNARIVLAGNGVTDVGTSPLSEAAANRMCHVYVETDSALARESWLTWAEENDVSPLTRGFTKFKPDIWSSDEDMDEHAKPTSRSLEFADRILTAAEGVNFKTNDILQALVCGCIGTGAGTELMAFRDLYNQIDLDDAIAHPDTARIPIDLGLTYAISQALAERAKDDLDVAEAVARYGLRWPEEPAAFLFRRLLQKNPGVITRRAYRAWNDRHRGTAEYIDLDAQEDTTTGAGVDRAPYLKIVAALNGEALPDGDQWVNRIQIKSESSNSKYILSQRRSNGEWACSCPGWATRKSCKHITELHAVLAR